MFLFDKSQTFLEETVFPSSSLYKGDPLRRQENKGLLCLKRGIIQSAEKSGPVAHNIRPRKRLLSGTDVFYVSIRRSAVPK